MLFVSDLIGKNIQEISFKFIYSLHKLIEENNVTSIKSSEVWEKMNMDTTYDKNIVLPKLVDILINTGDIKTGKNPDEVTLVYKKHAKTFIYILDLFNNLVNNSEGTTFGVTLNVNGSIISGNLISLKKYYDLLQNSMIQRLSGQNQQDWNDVFNAIKDGLPKTYEEHEMVSRIFGRSMICLEDISYLINGQLVNINISPSIWIGKIEDVNGFTFGKFSNIMN